MDTLVTNLNTVDTLVTNLNTVDTLVTNLNTVDTLVTNLNTVDTLVTGHESDRTAAQRQWRIQSVSIAEQLESVDVG